MVSWCRSSLPGPCVPLKLPSHIHGNPHVKSHICSWLIPCASTATGDLSGDYFQPLSPNSCPFRTTFPSTAYCCHWVCYTHLTFQALSQVWQNPRGAKVGQLHCFVRDFCVKTITSILFCVSLTVPTLCQSLRQRRYGPHSILKASLITKTINLSIACPDYFPGEILLLKASYFHMQIGS